MTRPLLALIVSVLAPATAPSPQAAAETSVAEGELLYRVHCASCHGEDARGTGPMREALKVPPADLTRLRQRHDGKFPWDEAREIIDGRTEVRGHGSSAMPVWGLTFQDPGRDASQETEVQRRIEALLHFLESVQTGPGD